MSEHSLARILERFASTAACYFVTVGKANGFLPKAGYPEHDETDGRPIPTYANPLIRPKDAARNVGISGKQLVDTLTARREKTGRLRRFLRAVALGQFDQAWDLWPQLELALEGAWLAAGSDTVPTPPAEEDAVLAGFLMKHANAIEDEARAAVNAALPSGVKKMTLDALRKHPAWKMHVNRRIGEYMDANPDDTIEQIANVLDYSKSTVHGSDAYEQRRDARKERKDRKKAEKERAKRRNRRDALWRIARARIRELDANHWGKRDAEGCRRYLLQHQSEIAWVDREWPAYVKSLSKPDLTRLLSSPPQDQNDLSPEEEDARIKARVRGYQRQRDNTRD